MIVYSLSDFDNTPFVSLGRLAQVSAEKIIPDYNMDFSSFTEFPTISQVWSPSDATAQTHTAAQGTVFTGAQLAGQIRA